MDRYKHFKWTPRTAWLSIIFAIAIPSSLYYVANKTDVSRFFLYFRTAENVLQELDTTEGEVKQEEVHRGLSMGLRLEVAKMAHARATTARVLRRQIWAAKAGMANMQQLKASQHQAPETRLNTRNPTFEMTDTNRNSLQGKYEFRGKRRGDTMKEF